MSPVRVTAVVPAAGASKRMGREKLFLKINGRPLLLYALMELDRTAYISELIVVTLKKRIEEVGRYRIRKLKAVVEGGPRRSDSVYNGLRAVSEDTDLVLIHDGARPFVTQEVIRRVIRAARSAKAAICGVPVGPTIKEVNKEGLVVSTLNRESLWEIQTPQVFKRELIVEAYRRAEESDRDATDDAALVERLGHRVRVVLGSSRNIKITTPEDLSIARAIISEQ